MALRNSQYDLLIRTYNQKQLKNRHTLDLRIQEIYKRIPRVEEINQEIASISVAQAKELLNGNLEEKCTTIDTLQNEGLLDFNLKNPLTNESISNDLCVYTTLSTDGTLIHEFSI